jgi:S1-C subfamily serine protease
MPGDLLDVVLLVACALFGITGYRQGFLIGALSFAGFLGGGAFAAWLAPGIAQRWFPGRNVVIVGVVVVVLGAIVGQVLASSLGALLRRRVTWRPARTVDAFAGALVSVCSVLLVAWLVGSAVAQSSVQSLARQTRDSQVLGAVDRVMPDSARVWFSAFRRMLDNYGFPQVFGSLQDGHLVPVSPPDPAILATPALRAARRDVVKVRGFAPTCGRQLEGSGFVYAPERVLTNAHVVAGVSSVLVRPEGRGGRGLPARVVGYDSGRDVAVLYVPGLTVHPLSFAGAATRGASAVVAGYPQDGPFTAVAARIRDRELARGPDIYQTRQVTREIYALRAIIRPGNSGGPLLAPSGKVYGVVFAAALNLSDTGYALTGKEVAPVARAGRDATRAVSTGGCD